MPDSLDFWCCAHWASWCCTARRPAFVSYAREFFGEKAAFTAGWLYWLNWAMTSIVDVNAVALYMNFFKTYWVPLAAIPQWSLRWPR